VGGMLLIGLGIWLGLQASGRVPPLAAAGLVAAAGLAVLVARAWGRLLGLVVSSLGLAFMVFAASQANVGQGRNVAEVFFADSSGHFSWADVFIRSALFAIGFALTGALLVAPFTRHSAGSAQTGGSAGDARS
jgi:hypothetical protein